LNVFPIVLPPLRERRQDIPALVTHYVETFSRRIAKRIDHISADTMSALVRYEWPGNIRELRNLIERAVILSNDGVLPNPLPPLVPNGDAPSVEQSGPFTVWSDAPSRSGTTSAVTREPCGEREIIEAALAESRGRVSGPSGACVKLGIPPSTLESRIKALRIRKAEFKFARPRSSSQQS
jgi:transcriptional regulator with GAF, ATPase, and Fis domain